MDNRSFAIGGLRRLLAIIGVGFLLLSHTTISAAQPLPTKSDQLVQVYQKYILVRFCHSVSQSDFLGYVTDEDLDEARRAAKAKEKFLNADMALDVNRLWTKAQESMSELLGMLKFGSNNYNESLNNLCNDSLAFLTMRTQGFEPDAMEKDF